MKNNHLKILVGCKIHNQIYGFEKWDESWNICSYEKTPYGSKK